MWLSQILTLQAALWSADLGELLLQPPQRWLPHVAAGHLGDGRHQASNRRVCAFSPPLHHVALWRLPLVLPCPSHLVPLW